MPGEFLQQFLRVIGKGWQDVLTPAGWPTISQPQCGRCHRASSGQTTLEIIGSKWSYALNWYKLNNDDDDGDDDGNDDDLQGNLNSSGLQFELAYWLVGKEIYTR